MIEDVEKFREMLDAYPVCKECIRLQQDWENEESFKLLIHERKNIPSEVYGTTLTFLYCMDTEDVQYTTLMEAFSGVNREDLMYRDDIFKLDAMPDEIEIFRGTQDYNESVPRFSWSLKEKVARHYGIAHMFRAVVKKEQVLAYYSKNGDEEEIIIRLETGYERIY